MDSNCNLCPDFHTSTIRGNMNKSRCRINGAGRMIDLSEGPVIMGILNTTPDSFYDGGVFQNTGCGVDLDRALDHALAMIEAGASIIDIGGESSRPGAEVISIKEEIERTTPLIAMLRKRTDAVISIDTYKAEVAEHALKAGAHLVNDISGFTFDHSMPEICREYQAAVILMHTQVRPESMGWSTGIESAETDIVAKVSSFLANSIAQAEAHGIEEIIIDPGFGFGKSVEENFLLLAELGSLGRLGRPILAGVSRKSFLGYAIAKEGDEIPPPSQRLPATMAAETIALLNGASILRVHDVEAAAQCLRVAKRVLSGLGGRGE